MEREYNTISSLLRNFPRRRRPVPQTRRGNSAKFGYSTGESQPRPTWISREGYSPGDLGYNLAACRLSKQTASPRVCSASTLCNSKRGGRETFNFRKGGRPTYSRGHGINVLIRNTKGRESSGVFPGGCAKPRRRAGVVINDALCTA